MTDERKEVDYEIVEQENKSALGGLLDSILDSLGGLEADMRKTDELARHRKTSRTRFGPRASDALIGCP